MLTKRDLLLRSAALAAITATAKSTAAHAQTAVSPAEARAIAKDAYIYGFPMVDSYRIQHAYFVDRRIPEYKAPWNQIRNIPRVYHAGGQGGADAQLGHALFDGSAWTCAPSRWCSPCRRSRRSATSAFSSSICYTHNFDYIGSRATGNDGGSFLIAGPDWKGETPKGVKKVIRSETELVLAAYRTQLFNPGDLDNVKKVQAGYKAQPLSAFLGQPAPTAAPAIDFIKPLTPETQKTSLEFFNILNFVLQFCPTVPSETELMARFAKIGVGAGQDHRRQHAFARDEDRPSSRAWPTRGRNSQDFKSTQIDTGKVTSGDLFGTREFLKNNYLYRMAAAVLGIYGNSKAEAMYPIYSVDADGPEARRLDEPLHAALRAGPAAAGQRVLVADDV